MIFFLDTNILVYLIDPAAGKKKAIARQLLIAKKPGDALVLSPQSLNECYRVITDRRSFMPKAQARIFVESLMPYCTAPLNAQTLALAWRVQDAGFSFWDSVLIASALQAECTHFFSEDMQHEREIFGMTILNPFEQSARDI